MKSSFVKFAIFFILISLSLTFYSSLKYVIHTKVFKLTRKNVSNAVYITNSEELIQTKEDSLKYILQWTSDSNVPFVYMGKGQEGFIERKCPYTNCFVTSNQSYLSDYTKFDVIAFAGPELSQYLYYNIQIPERRSPHQKFVFASIESAQNYPLCGNEYNNFFNWTWTYKLESEVHWGYIVIRDLQNNIIGPREDMNWLKPEEMTDVSYEFKQRLTTKTKAAAWFCSNCATRSRREDLVAELQKELNSYSCSNTICSVDIYGTCGPFECSRDHEEVCNKKLEVSYFFYLSFENSFSKDYVTEKLIRALNNNVVPIVYGGANYSRFLPEGSYLDARSLGVKKLAALMFLLMNTPDEYAKYFRWKNHYTYHKTSGHPETNEYCKFCSLLNDEKAVKEVSVYGNFEEWWNGHGTCNKTIIPPNKTI